MTLMYDFTGWLCVDCHLTNAGRSPDQIGHDSDPETDGPMSLVEVGTVVIAGIHDDEHQCEDRNIGLRSLIGCGEETRDFDTAACDGCGSLIAGPRYAATFWHDMTFTALTCSQGCDAEYRASENEQEAVCPSCGYAVDIALDIVPHLETGEHIAISAGIVGYLS